MTTRAAAAAAAGVLAAALTACGAGASGGKTHGAADSRENAGSSAGSSAGRNDGTARRGASARLPGVGATMRGELPPDARQVVTVRGEGRDSAESTVRLYTRGGDGWRLVRTWAAHNGRKGWTRDHREDDKRSPVGVFTLTDAGGLRPAPDAQLPYTHDSAFKPPSYWPKKTRHDFDHVIAVDYNRVKGTSPLDPTRPQGQSKGGGIWLHLDHGSGTSGCVSLPESGMRFLLRTLDPEKNPAVVMGDRKSLAR